MSEKSSPVAWVPPLLAGAAAAVASEVSMSLLLYAGPGLVRSLTTVLTVQAAALSVGLWSAPVAPRPDLLEAVRRRWVLCLASYLVATLYSASWSVLEMLGGGPLGQGLGLGLMAALPLYACGTVLGGMRTVESADGRGGARSVGGAAFAGAVIGFAATGFALPRALAPASLFLACLIILSAGGLAWGGARDRRLRTEVKARRPSPWGEVRVEDRRLPAAGQSVRVLLEGDHVRRWVGGDDAAVVPWDVSVLRAWASGDERAGRVLLVGGGASILPVAAVREFSSVSVDVLERNPVVVELGREHLKLGLSDESQRVRRLTGNLADHLDEMAPGTYDLVVLDTAALQPVGGVSGLSRAEYSGLYRVMAPEGAVVLGPAGSSRAVPDGWMSGTLRRALAHPVEGLEVAWPSEELVLVAFPSADLPWLGDVEGFVLEGEVPPTASAPPAVSS